MSRSADLVDRQGSQVGHSGSLDLLFRTGVPVDDDSNSDNLGSSIACGRERLEGRSSCGRGVFEDDNPATGDFGAFNPALHAMRLSLFTDDERIDVEAAGGRGMEDRCGDRVGTHGQAPDGVDFTGAETGFFEHVEHDVSDERGGFVMKGRSPHVDVVVGDESGGESDFAVDDCKVADELDEALALGVVAFHASQSTIYSRPDLPGPATLRTKDRGDIRKIPAAAE